MAMIKKLTIRRFKGFSNFEIELGNFTVLVGENGAGKTTILEALYMAQLAFRRVFGGKDQPQLNSVSWQYNFGEVLRFGIPQTKAEDLWFKRQLDQPLELVVDYDVGLSYHLNSSRVDILNTDIFDTTTMENLSNMYAREDVREKVKSIYSLVPDLLRPVGALQPPEVHMNYNSMERQKSQGHLTGVLRNFVYWQWDSHKSEFRIAMEKLKEKIPWAEVLEPELSRIDDSVQILFKQDEGIYDIVSGGGGLSTVLSVSILSELGGINLILLDEPDSHLHSSLQAKVARTLYKLAQEGGRQIVLATHAPDFIDAVPVECILWVDRWNSTGRKTTSTTRLLERLGALTKAQALQLKNIKVILWLEGKTDLDILKMFATKTHKEEIFSNEFFEPAFNIKEGDKDKICEIQQLLCRILGEDIRIVAVRDADYRRLIEDVPRKPIDNKKKNARFFILSKKEIENYLLDPTAISKAYQIKVGVNNSKSQKLPSPEDIRNEIRQWAQNPSVHDMLKNKFIPMAVKDSRKDWTPDKRYSEAEKRFNTLYKNDEWLYENVPGKEALKFLNNRYRESTGLELSALDICEHMSIPPDILKILVAIEEALNESISSENKRQS